MKLQLLVETVKDQVISVGKANNISPEVVMHMCKNISAKYWKWVLQQWYANRIRLPEDAFRVHEALNKFQALAPKFTSQQKDINQYKRVSDLELVINDTLGIRSSTKVHDLNKPGVEVVSQQGSFTTVKVTNAKTLEELGEGTRWCTRGSYRDPQADHYLDSYGKLYIIFQNGRPVIQYTPDYEQIMDINDNEVKDKRLLALIPKPELSSYYDLSAGGGLFGELLRDASVADLNNIYNYIFKVSGNRWPEAEPIIMKSPRISYLYAKKIIKGRWPEAEPIIMTSPQYAYEYALDIIKGRWVEAEPIIMLDPLHLQLYAENIIKGRWPEAEPVIFANPGLTRSYRNIVRAAERRAADPDIQTKASPIINPPTATHR